jgi:selenocysteine lyase/cysteine desulfurase
VTRQCDGLTPDWQAIRREFPTLERFSYLDIGKKAILPRAVERAMQEWLADVYEQAGANAFSMQCTEDTRRTVAEVFGMPAACTALIKNTSEGMNIVAQGFPWRDGDNVVLSEFEHENHTFPWRHLARRGVQVRIAVGDPLAPMSVDRYRKLVDARTRVLAVSWVAYGNGARADIPAFAAFCRERGITLVVDGIQAVGVLAERVADLGADVLAAGGHKAQFSLAGAGFMYTAPDLIDRLTPPYAAKFSFTSNDRTAAALELAHDAHRFEYGNPNFLGIWVQRRAAQYVQRIGLHHIEDRVRELTTRLIEGAERRQIRVRTPRAWAQRAGHVSFDLGVPAAAAVAFLRERGVVVSEKDGHLRASAHFYNDESDIDRLLELLPAAAAAA